MKSTQFDKLDYMIQLAYLQCGTKDAELFDEVDGTEVPVPKSLDRRIMRLISREAREQCCGKTKRMLGRTAIAAMLIMSIMFTLLISVTGIREAIWKAIVEWHDNYITISFEKNIEDIGEEVTEESTAEDTQSDSSTNSQPETDDEPSLENKPVVTPPTKIEEVRKPTYVIDETIEDLIQSKTSVFVDCYQGNEIIYSFSQVIIDEEKKYFDNETASVDEIYINGYNASLVTYSDKQEVEIVWSDGEYVYVLFSSMLDVQQMKTIAESVKAQ